MRGSIAIFCFAGAFAASSALAQRLDLNSQTCKDFSQESHESVGYTLAWLDGYYKDEEEPAIIDFDKLKGNEQKLARYCADHPDATLGAAAEALFGK